MVGIFEMFEIHLYSKFWRLSEESLTGLLHFANTHLHCILLNVSLSLFFFSLDALILSSAFYFQNPS